ncbi:HlyD family secretion protein [Trichocoleus sp. FACHB-262]|uniref:HlyD family secretion protein n=1 Tax=Trichocoleus sp. FACHB-262 TaxID=2692869 RepID=UPI001688C956|nr:HlyD family efflux transporter periplasmic adaptor subunit [Trichocoleus sp. FACHB-262]MBD2121866.1 HlyD family efflux transporter periplasmic adaptor subunit [Trichocoleus sp. FACHB-262]
MNPNSASQSRPALKVVPPEMIASSPKTSVPPQPTAQPTSTPHHSQRWFMLGLITVGMGILSQVPVPNYLPAPTELTSTTQARQAVTVPYAGIVRIHVHPEQSVVPGQLVAEVNSDQLSREISEAEITLEVAKAALNNAQQNLQIVQKTYQEVQAVADSAQLATAQIAADARAIADNNPPPMVKSLRADIETLQTDLKRYESDVERYQRLVAEGVYNADAAPVTDVINRRDRIKPEIESKRQQIRELEKQTQERLERQQAEEMQKQIAVSTARESVVAAEVELRDKQQLVIKQTQKLQSLRSQLEKLKVTATVAGTVVTANLDLLQNQSMQPGQKLLDIVELKYLTANVKVSQQDYSLISLALQNASLQATFHPRDTVGRVYPATVTLQNINSIATAEMSQQPSELTVQISIDNHDNLLRPGMRGTTHINVGRTPLYQRVQREFLRLVPIEKWKLF